VAYDPQNVREAGESAIDGRGQRVARLPRGFNNNKTNVVGAKSVQLGNEMQSPAVRFCQTQSNTLV